MEVVLLERIERLGQMGDVVNVKPGYARNYLLPQKKALRATKENLVQFEAERQQLEADNLLRRDEAQSVADRLDGLQVVVIRSAGESGQLYGSVNARDMAEVVTEAGYTVGRHQVIAEGPAKALGFHDFRVRLHPVRHGYGQRGSKRGRGGDAGQARPRPCRYGRGRRNDALDDAPDAAELLEPEVLEAIAAEETAVIETEAELGDEESTTDTEHDVSESGEEVG